MDALTFFGLEPTANPNSWRLPVVPSLISGTGALFGGCGLGAAIEVMERVTGRPCIWATAQFLSFARPPAVLELDVVEAVRGHQISQARVIARVGDREILTVVGRARPATRNAQRSVVDASRRAAARRLPAAPDDEPSSGHDHGSLRVQARRRAPLLGAHGHRRVGQRVAVGAAPRARSERRPPRSP